MKKALLSILVLLFFACSGNKYSADNDARKILQAQSLGITIRTTIFTQKNAMSVRPVYIAKFLFIYNEQLTVINISAISAVQLASCDDADVKKFGNWLINEFKSIDNNALSDYLPAYIP